MRTTKKNVRVVIREIVQKVIQGEPLNQEDGVNLLAYTRLLELHGPLMQVVAETLDEERTNPMRGTNTLALEAVAVRFQQRLLVSAEDLERLWLNGLYLLPYADKVRLTELVTGTKGRNFVNGVEV